MILGISLMTHNIGHWIKVYRITKINNYIHFDHYLNNQIIYNI